MTTSKHGGPAVKSLVATVPVAALCLALDPEEMAAVVGGADLPPLATALAVSVVGVLISAEKWCCLLRRAGVGLSQVASAWLYRIGMFVSNFLPTSVGGDAAKLARTPAPEGRAAVAGSILVERLAGRLLVMLGRCTLGLALRPRHFDEPALRELFLAVVLAPAFGVVAALLAPARVAAVLSRLAGRLPAILRRPTGAAARVVSVVAGLTRDRAGLARAMGLSHCFYGTIILAQHGLLGAVGADVAPRGRALVVDPLPPSGLRPGRRPAAAVPREAGFQKPEATRKAG